jgi:hypothetical protein
MSVDTRSDRRDRGPPHLGQVLAYPGQQFATFRFPETRKHVYPWSVLVLIERV